ncbi:MAG TPA: hypothetical protein VKE92_02645, partial [Anaerolineales bacterium]|nr:hypothetical protein [Anaerolineales bacterium]
KRHLILYLGDCIQKDIHNMRVEMFPGLVLDILGRLLPVPCLSIRPIAGQCIPHIHHCKDAG